MLKVLLASAAAAVGAGGARDTATLEHCGTSGAIAVELEQAAQAAAYDEATGRDLRNFPPDRVVDYRHMTLRLRFDDFRQRRFEATEVLTFAPIAAPAGAITLDAVGLDIEAVSLGGRPVEHFADGRTLVVRFDPPLPRGKVQELVIDYSCTDPYDGMIFTLPSQDAPGYGPEVHTQGETETNRHWFACHDAPNERLTTELIVDVPSGLEVSGNGRLVSRSDDGTRAVWHYLQDKPHPSYLVSLVIGSFDVVPLHHPRVPLAVWVPKGLGDLVPACYGNTGAMVDLFEKRFGVPYPWARYDQILAKNFDAGGMENTSATTMHPTAILDRTAMADRDLDGLIAHELAHQWMGDLLTCKSWTHIWLNEGGASYGEVLWMEERDGPDGYLDAVQRDFEVARRDVTTNDQPMVSPVWEHPWENFRRRASPYSKGAAVFHMLRMMLGDEAFFAGLQLYLERNSLGLVETSDLRYAMEEASGLGLEWFFDQWCYRPGTPQLDVDIAYDGRSRELSVQVEQTQPITERTPAFRFVLPVYVRTGDAEQTLKIDVRQKSTSFRATLDRPPDVVAVDPWLHVLKTVKVNTSPGLWVNQLELGPTIVARRAAIEAIGGTDTAETVDILVSVLADESERHTLRRAAARALGDCTSRRARARLLEIARNGVEDPKVRVTIVEQLTKCDAADAVPVLAAIAADDASYATRVAAIEGLAHHKAKEQADLIVSLVEVESQHDDVRRASLAALGELDDPRGLDLAIRFSAYGTMDRARADAVKAVGKLAKHDTERAVPYLIALLDDPEERTVRAAGAALAATKDERGRKALQALSESCPDPRMREDAKEWVEKMGKEEAAQRRSGAAAQGEE